MAETGKELTVPHQMSLAGAVSLPVFWLAGAGAAVFWVLGKQKSHYCVYTVYLQWSPYINTVTRLCLCNITIYSVPFFIP